MAGAPGFEPGTRRLKTSCSTGLNYTPTELQKTKVLARRAGAFRWPRRHGSAQRIAGKKNLAERQRFELWRRSRACCISSAVPSTTRPPLQEAGRAPAWITTMMMLNSGGEGGIRTREALAGLPPFQGGDLNRSSTSPKTRAQRLGVLQKSRRQTSHLQLGRHGGA